MMTVTAIAAGLLPILWNEGTGSEGAHRRADDRRYGELDAPHRARDFGDLWAGEGHGPTASLC